MARNLFRTLIVSSIVFCTTGINPATVSADLVYDFLGGQAGNVWARLRLSSLPATHAEIVSLKFFGEGLNFGFGHVYGGSFDTSQDLTISDGTGGLMGTIGSSSENTIEDLNPPPSTANPSDEPASFRLYFAQATDVMLYEWGGLGGSGSVAASGSWQLSLVPEPSGILVVLSMLLFTGHRHPRRRPNTISDMRRAEVPTTSSPRLDRSAR